MQQFYTNTDLGTCQWGAVVTKPKNVGVALKQGSG